MRETFFSRIFFYYVIVIILIVVVVVVKRSTKIFSKKTNQFSHHIFSPREYSIIEDVVVRC